MAVVQKDAQLEALEAAERELDLELAKQEKLASIAEKQRRLEELAASQPGGAGGAAGAVVTTRTATLTVKKGKYQEHSEAHSTTKSSGISVGLSKDAKLGYSESKGSSAELQWKKTEEVEGSLPINLDNAGDNTTAFLAAMGVTTEQILALKDK